MTANNFETQVLTEDFYPHSKLYGFFDRMGLLRSRRDNLFAIGKKHNWTVESRPEWLYTYPMGSPRVSQTHVIMGENERGHLGTGWHDFEYWPPGIRWTQKEAKAFFLLKDDAQFIGFRAGKALRTLKGELLINGHSAGEFTLQGDEETSVLLPIPKACHEAGKKRWQYYSEVTIRFEDLHVLTRNLGVKEEKREVGAPIHGIALLQEKALPDDLL